MCIIEKSTSWILPIWDEARTPKKSTRVLEHILKLSTECQGLGKRINRFSKHQNNAVNIKQAIVASSVPTTAIRTDIEEGVDCDDGQQQFHFVI